jgi:MOSC domain-containing protein YiiM
MNSKVIAVNRSDTHSFSKTSYESIKLIADFGVEGDAHAGKTIKHVFLANKDPQRKNIRQVHLIQSEILAELANKGFAVGAGDLGENITTQGIDLLSLPESARLHIGDEVVIELTALRNPCVQIDTFKKGLLKQVVSKDEQGNIVRRLGVMAVVIRGGEVRPDDVIELELPKLTYKPLRYIW